jgi:pseudomonalisin
MAATGLSIAAQATSTTSATERLAWDVLPGISRLVPTGSPATDEQLHIGVMLANPQAGALQQFAYAVNDPRSPIYRDFLSPAEIDARFGLPDSTGSALRSWLTGGGLHISYASPSNDFVQAVGTVSQAERLFHVTLRSYQVAGKTFVANVNAPVVPAELRVNSLMGLNTLQQFSTPAPVVAKHTHPAATGCVLVKTPCEEGYDARDMWGLYNMPAGNYGQGQTMAIFGEGQTDPVVADLRRFEQYNRLPRVPVRVVHVGAGPFVSNDGQGEWDLDSQSSTGMSPDVNGLTLYFSHSLSDADVMTEFSAWIHDRQGPRQANASFGECETDPLNPVVGNPAANPSLPAGQGLGDNLEPAAESTLMPMILAEGRTLFASTGDTGSSCPLLFANGIGAGNGVLNQAVPLPNYPASSKYAVAVGGTLLYSNGGTPPQRSTVAASPFTGGGTSFFNSEPPWQAKVSTIAGPCAVNSQGSPYPPGTVCRAVPDVAALFGDVIALGYDIFYNGSLLTTGGTSLSSPTWMGMWTRIQAAYPDQRKGTGSAAPILYAKGTGPNYAKDFYDVTTGSNGYYTALPGWDYVSGFGEPNLANLMRDIAGRTAPVRPDQQVQAPLQPFNRCGLAFTSPAGNAIDYNLYATPAQVQPQLDVTAGRLSLSPDRQHLRTVMTIENLTLTTPPDASPASTILAGGEDWIFDVVVNGVTYYADAHYETDQTGVTFTAGKVNPATGFRVSIGTIPGQIKTGPHGTITMDLPLSQIGSPKRGSRIQEPFAYTALNSLLPFLNFPDAAGAQYDYALGSHC